MHAAVYQALCSTYIHKEKCSPWCKHTSSSAFYLIYEEPAGSLLTESKELTIYFLSHALSHFQLAHTNIQFDMHSKHGQLLLPVSYSVPYFKTGPPWLTLQCGATSTARHAKTSPVVERRALLVCCTVLLIRLYLDKIGRKCKRAAMYMFTKVLALLWCGRQLLQIIASFFSLLSKFGFFCSP